MGYGQQEHMCNEIRGGINGENVYIEILLVGAIV